MRKTKDPLGEVAEKANRKESKDKQRELKKIMLNEGKTQYSVWINSKADDPKSLDKSLYRRYWAVSPEKAGEMGLAEALMEGHIEPTIYSIEILEARKKK